MLAIYSDKTGNTQETIKRRFVSVQIVLMIGASGW